MVVAHRSDRLEDLLLVEVLGQPTPSRRSDGAPVDRPTSLETTALGAAYRAGLQSGLYPEPSAFAARWALDRRFTPAMDAATRARKIAAWRDAVGRTLTGKPP